MILLMMLCRVGQQVSVTLFFLPVGIMSVAYALIAARLWGSKPPGEKLDSTVNNQDRAKKKVSARSISDKLAVLWMSSVLELKIHQKFPFCIFSYGIYLNGSKLWLHYRCDKEWSENQEENKHVSLYGFHRSDLVI